MGVGQAGTSLSQHYSERARPALNGPPGCPACGYHQPLGV